MYLLSSLCHALIVSLDRTSLLGMPWRHRRGPKRLELSLKVVIHDRDISPHLISSHCLLCYSGPPDASQNPNFDAAYKGKIVHHLRGMPISCILSGMLIRALFEHLSRRSNDSDIGKVIEAFINVQVCILIYSDKLHLMKNSTTHCKATHALPIRTGTHRGGLALLYRACTSGDSSLLLMSLTLLLNCQ